MILMEVNFLFLNIVIRLPLWAGKLIGILFVLFCFSTVKVGWSIFDALQVDLGWSIEAFIYYVVFSIINKHTQIIYIGRVV